MAGRGGPKPKPGDFSRKKKLQMRMAALIKNLDPIRDEDVGMIKFFEVFVTKMEKRLGHIAEIKKYRAARNRINADKAAAVAKELEVNADVEVIDEGTDETEAAATGTEDSSGDGQELPVDPKPRQPRKTAANRKA